MQFWASVDNVAGLASLDAHTLLGIVQHSNPNPDWVKKQQDRISKQLDFAEGSAKNAAWINPATGWALYKFYKRVIEETRQSIDFKFEGMNTPE